MTSSPRSKLPKLLRALFRGQGQGGEDFELRSLTRLDSRAPPPLNPNPNVTASKGGLFLFFLKEVSFSSFFDDDLISFCFQCFVSKSEIFFPYI